jgi:hypothetical protein
MCPPLDPVGADGKRVAAFLDLVDKVDANTAQRLGKRADGAPAHLRGCVEMELAVAGRGECRQE